MQGGTPHATMREKRGTPSPSSSAFVERTVGGSWQWSPTRTSCLQPLVRGTRVAGSVAWVASSTRTLSKIMPSRISPPDPIQVQQTIWAFLMVFIFSLKICAPVAVDWIPENWPPSSMPSMPAVLALLAPAPPCPDPGLSTQYLSSSGLMASGLPSLTTLRPALAQPSTRLSTAMFESLVASTGELLVFAQWLMILMATAVFPVPGGPWTRVSLFVTAWWTASLWEELRPSSCPVLSSASLEYALMLSSSSPSCLASIGTA
mmetsp:Transcript_10731/g.21372  ORF Transcript_10731/g.21372 Transcript_10731/m.21372 type:complete len:261 (-) Transcript_10731:1320-2102(-)